MSWSRLVSRHGIADGVVIRITGQHPGRGATAARAGQGGRLHSRAGPGAGEPAGDRGLYRGGELFTAGDTFEPFSIQSISKALSLTLALTLYREGDLGQGRQNPLGAAVQLPGAAGVRARHPRNPFINAGALVVSDLLETRLTAPRQRTLELARRLSGNPVIMADQVVARSEYQHAARNAAIAYLMKAYGNRERGGQGAAELFQCLRHPA